MTDKRGSEKLLGAWRARTLAEDQVVEIGQAFEESPAVIEEVRVHGGADATGLTVSLRYDGDDIPFCGNDLSFWLKWHSKFGGVVPPPRIIINGTPWPEALFMQLHFGSAPDAASASIDLANVAEMGLQQ